MIELCSVMKEIADALTRVDSSASPWRQGRQFLGRSGH
jgi:hypothetical protein